MIEHWPGGWRIVPQESKKAAFLGPVLSRHTSLAVTKPLIHGTEEEKAEIKHRDGERE